jgi:hypothetical protein
MDATLVAGWEALCQQLAPAFTRPTFVTFLHIATGWVLCRSRPTVTNLVCTVGTHLLGHVAKHWTVYERFFYRASWSLNKTSRLLLGRVVAPLIRLHGVEAVIDLKIDDTTCGRCGRHVAFAGYFKDASTSNVLKTVVHWSHNWVIGCVAMRPRRWPNWVLGLPVWFTLYRKPADCTRTHPFRTRQQIAADMIRQTRGALPDRVIRVAADGQYATGTVAQAAADAATNLVSRIRSDAALYALPPKRRRYKRGRTPKKGRRLPTPKRLARRRNGWRTVRTRVYGKRVERQVLSVVCLWYHVCKDRPIKLLIVRDPSGQQTDDYMFCTDPTVSEAEMIERFAARWPIEESIHDGKQLCGFEQVQGWCPRTVVRQAPMAMIVQTLVKAWYLRYGVKATSAQPKGTAWAGSKDHPSYLDMLATLRKALWTDRINMKSPLRRGIRELWKTLQFTLCAAA